MASVTVRARGNPAGVARLVGPTGDVGRWFRGFVRTVETDAKRGAPVDTGHLRQSINSDVSGTGDHLRGVIRASTDYALYVHEPTSPHVIEPTTTRALRFTIGGDVVFATSVKHPGTTGNPFLRAALLSAIRRI